ncbi:MAG TPA: hypothetical protein VM899_10585, partial [Rubellimicrobium sp.]|nr:hypothetical protein [Rubellimicrobium sp.]
SLRQELRQEGLGAVSVSISGGESRQGDGRTPSGRQDHVGPAFGAETATSDLGSLGPSDLPLPRQARTSGHLDLRF